MQVRFYFDPLCPWCWITSHWLDDHVAPHRDLSIDWRPISLFVRNEGRELPESYARLVPVMDHSFKLLRVVEALRAAGHADRIRAVYVAFGQNFHAPDAPSTDPDTLDIDAVTAFDVAAALESAGVDREFAGAYDDPQWDDAVRAATAEAEAVAGDDVGTPIIAYEVDGEWKGYFGPVIPEVVKGEAALQLWDGLAALIRTDGFYELKRTRDVGPRLDSL